MAPRKPKVATKRATAATNRASARARKPSTNASAAASSSAANSRFDAFYPAVDSSNTVVRRVAISGVVKANAPTARVRSPPRQSSPVRPSIEGVRRAATTTTESVIPLSSPPPPPSSPPPLLYDIDCQLKISFKQTKRKLKESRKFQRHSFKLDAVEEIVDELILAEVGDEEDYTMRVDCGIYIPLRRSIKGQHRSNIRFSLATHDMLLSLADELFTRHGKQIYDLELVFEVEVDCPNIRKDRRLQSQQPQQQPQHLSSPAFHTQSIPPIITHPDTQAGTPSRGRQAVLMNELTSRKQMLEESHKHQRELLQSLKCTDLNCPRVNKYCWLMKGGPEQGLQHYAVESDLHGTWANAIRDGRADLNTPPYEVVQLMLQNGPITRESKYSRRQGKLTTGLQQIGSKLEEQQEQMALWQLEDARARREAAADSRESSLRLNKLMEQKMMMDFSKGLGSQQPQLTQYPPYIVPQAPPIPYGLPPIPHYPQPPPQQQQQRPSSSSNALPLTSSPPADPDEVDILVAIVDERIASATIEETRSQLRILRAFMLEQQWTTSEWKKAAKSRDSWHWKLARDENVATGHISNVYKWFTRYTSSRAKATVENTPNIAPSDLEVAGILSGFAHSGP